MIDLLAKLRAAGTLVLLAALLSTLVVGAVVDSDKALWCASVGLATLLVHEALAWAERKAQE